MKTLIALAAASFITTSAMATDMQLPDTSKYTVVIAIPPSHEGPILPGAMGVPMPPGGEGEPSSIHCYFDFQPMNDSRINGSVFITCNNEAHPEMSWDATNYFISFTVDGELRYARPGQCQEWPSLEVGETVSDPCWLSSTTGTPVQVTRTE